MQNYTIDNNGLLHVDNLSVGGSLDLRGTGITTLPDNLSVGGSLDLRGTGITTLPDNLSVGGSLYLRGTGITTLPDNLSVGGSLDLDVENYTNVLYKHNCGSSGRIIFAVKLRDGIKIAAGCFLGSLDEFCDAVDESYNDEAAEQYKQDGKEIVCILQKMI